jgi:type IV secretory pathway TraG/TraD family ATPase VirD4
MTADPKLVGSFFAGVQTTLGFLSNSNIIKNLTPTSKSIDFRNFLINNESLYVAGTASLQQSLAPIVSLIIEELTEEARNYGASLGGRCTPPLSLILDEAANIAPLPTLPSLLSDGGGSGIFVFFVLQSLNQAKERWGVHQANAMFEASSIKILLPGITDPDLLKLISVLSGTKFEKRKNDMEVEVPVLKESLIRSLKPKHAVLVHRRISPIQIRLGA